MPETHYAATCDSCCNGTHDRKDVICSVCGGAISFHYKADRVISDTRYGTSIWRYWRHLPLEPDEGLITLAEGGTPIHRSRHFGADRQIWLKDDTRNPTGSHKDRALALGINHARQIGKRVSIVVSAGSTGLSHAAYAARAELVNVTLISSETPPERAYPLYTLGSRVVQVNAAIDEILEALNSIASELDVYVNSTTRLSNPYQAEASKTISYEITEQLGDAPDWLIVPVGGGGTIAGIWRGFQESRKAGQNSKLPRLIGVVPRTHDTLERAFSADAYSLDDLKSLAPKKEVPTILTKIAHAVPPDGVEALEAIRSSDGTVLAVSDDQALEAQAQVGTREGIYIEPSSATVIAGINYAIEHASDRDIIVALLCGSGFRETFINLQKRPINPESCKLRDLHDCILKSM